MSDDIYQDEINDILFYLNSNRATGRTNRLVNEIVEKFEDNYPNGDVPLFLYSRRNH